MSKQLKTKDLIKLLEAETDRLNNIIDEKRRLEIAEMHLNRAICESDPQYQRDKDAYNKGGMFYCVGCSLGLIKNKYITNRFKY